MAIFLNENSKVIVQGITGSEGTKHTKRMLKAGTSIVGGVNPRKAGQEVDFDGTLLPVFASVGEAMEKTSADVSVVFVPPAFANCVSDENTLLRLPLSAAMSVMNRSIRLR